MSVVTQIAVTINQNYIAGSDVNIIYTDSEAQALEVSLEEPTEDVTIIIQDLGNAATNNISLTSSLLINGVDNFTINQNFSLTVLKFDFGASPTGTWTATNGTLAGYIIATEDVTLGPETKVVYVDSSAIGAAFTIELNPSPTLGDEVYIVDYTGNCGSINVTIDGNGKDIIGFTDALMNQDFIGYNLTYTGTQYNI